MGFLSIAKDSFIPQDFFACETFDVAFVFLTVEFLRLFGQVWQVCKNVRLYQFFGENGSFT